ncbi:MAG: GIY-YIG catalytic domain-containing protein [Candidatus Methanocomedens sp.]|nr:MAG: GIY-YIG catalytic domain-containing protein [ANME-2 cluster archaeon]
MNAKFEDIINQFSDLMQQLANSPLRQRNSLGDIPNKGIYVFYENNKPIYVGRSNRMKDRIQEHGRKSSYHNSATFAFILAKEIANEQGIDINKNRDALESDSTFRNIFLEQKERVSIMNVRVIEINGPITQTIFEVYVSMELNTEYNDFDTH